MSVETSENDLPMSANLQDITVRHFTLDLLCKMEEQVFEGSITLWCCPTIKNLSDCQCEENTDRGIDCLQAKGNISKIDSQDSSKENSIELCVDRTPTLPLPKDCAKECDMINGMCDKSTDSVACSSSTTSECDGISFHFASLQSDSNADKEGNSAVKVSGGVSLNEIKSINISRDHLDTAALNADEKGISTSESRTVDAVDYTNILGTDHSSVDTENSLGHTEDRKIAIYTGAGNNDFALNTEHTSLISNPECCGNNIHPLPQEKAESCSHFPSSFECPSDSSKPFKLILDSYKLNVQKVEGIFLLGVDKLQFEENPDEYFQQIHSKCPNGMCLGERSVMEFLVKEHCIHVFLQTADTVQKFPHAVQIWYQTHTEGPSLKWTTDQDGNPCVFTIGHFLSNRSLFPSQDVPTALFTWHASVTVDTSLTVILTGDRDPNVTVTEDGRKKFSFLTTFPMPSSTFGIAVGQWTMEKLSYGLLDDEFGSLSTPSLRLFFPQQLRERSMSVLGGYLPCCMLEVQKLLGTYPFHRLDILLVPACFDSLGLASPSLLFLSQSVLCPDGSMCVRVAHEICHTWFGIVIGPLDWTEEWMTEGFCTYLEDILHTRVTQVGEPSEDFMKLRAELHLRVLRAELQNTDEELQSLRPNKGTTQELSSAEETRFLKNGMNVTKKFMQVHYLKGYFLLKVLEMEVGRGQFLGFLKCYVQQYIYQLVTSQDFLQMFFSMFPEVKDLSVESINSEWLDCPGMPQRLIQSEDKEKSVVDFDSPSSAQVDQQLAAIAEACRRKRQRGQQARHHQQLPALDQLRVQQVVLLFDRLLEEERVPGHVLDLLKRTHNLHLANPEVCHRWCELVVKHRHKKCYSDLEQFLINHQDGVSAHWQTIRATPHRSGPLQEGDSRSMPESLRSIRRRRRGPEALGVYLYGEAMITECRPLIQLARNCFRRLQHDMPEGVRRTVSAMLYAT